MFSYYRFYEFELVNTKYRHWFEVSGIGTLSKTVLMSSEERSKGLLHQGRLHSLR